MAQHPVLGDGCGHQRIRIFIKKAVVAYAQSNHYVQVGLFFVQQLGLQDGIAHIFADLAALLRYADRCLFLCSCLTCYPIDFNPWLRRIAARIRLSLRRPTQVAIPSFSHLFVSKVHDLLYPGIFAVVLEFHLSSRDGHLTDFFVLITFMASSDTFWSMWVVRQIPERFCHLAAIFDCAVDT